MTIKGRKKISLTPESILARISEYDIFRMYMPDVDWKINVPTLSPFREERNPSFLIGNRGGYLSFIDFADTSKRGNCFNFVQMLYNVPTFDDTLKMIDRDFQLGISSGKVGNYKKIVSKYEQPEEAGKRYALIQVKTRKFTSTELSYWNDYLQDIEDLKREHIYSIDKIYLNKKLFTISDNELKFGYFYDGYWKIYRPFQDKRRKWMPNNVPITMMDGKQHITNCDVAFINKSKKDYMVMRKIFPCSCAVQNEGIACFSDENVQFLKENSKRQILSFDSDVAGVKNSKMITEIFGFGYCNVPRKYLMENIKDWADLVRLKGTKPVEQYLKHKGLL